MSAAIAVALSACPPTAQAADHPYFSDNSLSYRYGTEFKEPGVAEGSDITKSIANFQHYNTDGLGSNFVYIDALFSHDDDPAENGVDGAREIYAVYRRDWNASKILGSDFSESGIVRDLALHMGADANAKNSAFDPRKRLLVIGPQVQFAVPDGYFNIAFDYAKEWGNNGISRRDVSYDPTFQLESVWGLPFHALDLPWKFTGFLIYTAPKGEDGFGAQTRSELLLRAELLLEVGKLVDSPNAIELGVGYEYWHNKFGNDHDRVPGALAQTPMLIAKVHF